MSGQPCRGAAVGSGLDQISMHTDYEPLFPTAVGFRNCRYLLWSDRSV